MRYLFFYKISNAYVLKSIFYQLDSNIQFFPFGICQNQLKNPAKNRQIFAQFSTQNHNILWFYTSIFPQNHNESSEPHTQRGSRGQNECHLSVSVLGNISTTFLALSVGGNISTFNYHTIKCV